ncbi:MAG: glycosyltransferase, partial [Gemmatimonadaceae bacterium]
MLNLTAGGLSGGYKKYLQRLVPLLRTHSAISELLVAVPPGFESMQGVGAGALSWRPGDHWRGYPALRQQVRNWKPDVVLIPTARYLDCGAPVVSMVRNMQPMLPPTFRDGIPAWAKNHAGAIIARRACHASTRVIAVSSFVRNYLVDKWLVDPRRLGVVYHGVDAADEVPLPEILRPLANTPYVFVAGSLLPYRGVEDAVAALAHLDAAIKLVVAGDGSDAYKARILA